MTKYEVLKLAEDFENEANKDKYYKSTEMGGYTKEGWRVSNILWDEKVFKCPVCGEMVAFEGFSDTARHEHNFQDFMNDCVICEECEEDERISLIFKKNKIRG